MTQPTAAQGKLVDKSNNPQIQDRQAAITRITDSSTGTAGSSIVGSQNQDLNDDQSSLLAKFIEILDVLRYHNLIDGVRTTGGDEVSKAEAKTVDKSNIQQIGNRQAAITALTDSTGGIVSDTFDDTGSHKNDWATWARDINLALDAMEYHGLITGSGTKVTEAVSRFVDTNNTPQIGAEQNAIVDLTDSTSPAGVVSDTIDYNLNNWKDDAASMASKLNEMIEVLELHGLIADN